MINDLFSAIPFVLGTLQSHHTVSCCKRYDIPIHIIPTLPLRLMILWQMAFLEHEYIMLNVVKLSFSLVWHTRSYHHYIIGIVSANIALTSLSGTLSSSQHHFPFYDETYNATGGQTKSSVGIRKKRGRTNPRGCSAGALIVEKASTDLCPALSNLESTTHLKQITDNGRQVSINSSYALPPLQWWTTIHTVWTAYGVNDRRPLWTYITLKILI